MVLKVLLLDNLFKAAKLLHSTLVSAKALLKEATGSTAAFKLDKIHSTAFVWSPAGELMDNLTSESNTLMTLVIRHGKVGPKENRRVKI